MERISPALVEAWLKSADDHHHPQAQINAIERIMEMFGSLDLARRYVEVREREANL